MTAITRGRWGGWTIDTAARTLTHEEQRYSVDLDHTLSGAAVADWVFQIAAKPWGTEEVVGGFVKALAELWDGSAQPVLCPGGQNRQATPDMLDVRLLAIEAAWLSLS